MLRVLGVTALVLGLSACGNSIRTGGQGGVAAISLSFSASDIDAVTYEISGIGIDPAITGALTVEAGGATGTIDNIPSGEQRSIVIRAYSGRNEICSGLQLFDVIAGETVSVSIAANCQEATGALAVTVEASAVIDSARASIRSEDFSQAIDVPLRVTGSTINGTISDIPAGTGRELTVSASHEGTVLCLATTTVDVRAGQTDIIDDLTLECGTGVGGVIVDGTFNFFPLVHTMFASSTSVMVGETVDLEVVASDPDDDVLTVEWTADTPEAAAALADTDSFATRWDPFDLLNGTYTLTATVTDGITPAVSRSVEITVTGGSDGGGDGGDSPPATVVINELVYDVDGLDGPHAFVELVGPAGTDLTGWSLVAINGMGGATYRTLSLDGAAIPADGVLVIARDDAEAYLLEVRDFTANVDLQNGPDSVVLMYGAAVADAVGYGEFVGEAVFAGEGTPAAEPSLDQSLSRLGGADSDDNGVDFVAGVPTPGVL
ncbi:MAG: Ig-like domain-containing protein [Myxococcota bacterium]